MMQVRFAIVVAVQFESTGLSCSGGSVRTAGMTTQLVNMVRRNGRNLGIIAGIFLGEILTSVFNHRSVDWPATINGTLVGVLTVWGIHQLWVSRKCGRDAGERKVIAAIVIAGIFQFLFLMIWINRGLKPQGIEVWIAPVIMLGMVAQLVWKGLKSAAI